MTSAFHGGGNAGFTKNEWAASGAPDFPPTRRTLLRAPELGVKDSRGEPVPTIVLVAPAQRSPALGIFLAIALGLPVGLAIDSVRLIISDWLLYGYAPWAAEEPLALPADPARFDI